MSLCDLRVLGWIYKITTAVNMFTQLKIRGGQSDNFRLAYLMSYYFCFQTSQNITDQQLCTKCDEASEITLLIALITSECFFSWETYCKQFSARYS